MQKSLKIAFFLSATIIVFAAFTDRFPAKTISLFDGKTFQGWEGDTVNIWSIKDGAITAGSLNQSLPHNNFLCTKEQFSNFVLKLQVKLEGTGGFVNAGIQFRSLRLTDPAYEMIGYQADIGPGYWGALYDESRRNKILAKPDSVKVKKLVRENDWNNIIIRCQNQRIRVYLNGEKTVDYIERDRSLPKTGLIGLQIHGGGNTRVSYRNLYLTELK